MADALRWGVIGGTGLTALGGLQVEAQIELSSPYGAPSAPMLRGCLGATPVVFLPRHGPGHSHAPHRINYRANIWALARHARAIVAIAAVGAINARMAPGDLVVVDQVVDYTWGREHTFWDSEDQTMLHVDFTAPYAEDVRSRILAAARAAGVDCHDGGVYAATQGPRLESAAEIDRLERDGCDVVGMTGMPEAALARELGVPYASCAVVVNPAAGRGAGEISMELIQSNLTSGMDKVHRLLAALGNP